MTISRKLKQESNDPLALIERNFAGGDKVPREFVSHICELLHAKIKQSPDIDILAMDELAVLHSKNSKGVSANALHRDVYLFMKKYLNRLGGHSESSIAHLERQLQELRMQMTASADVDKKYRDLHQQLETLRKGMESGREVMFDKQEDMLQKFLSAEKKAFIIMPFQHEFDNVWLGAIKPACVESRYAPLRVDEVNLSTLITDDIERYADAANVVIVDLTGNNPNVMFELGWSLSKNKKPIVICQGEHASKVAFDVRGIRHIAYENSWLGIESLKKKLKEFISATEQHAPKKPIVKKRKAENSVKPKAK